MFMLAYLHFCMNYWSTGTFVLQELKSRAKIDTMCRHDSLPTFIHFILLVIVCQRESYFQYIKLNIGLGHICSFLLQANIYLYLCTTICLVSPFFFTKLTNIRVHACSHGIMPVVVSYHSKYQGIRGCFFNESSCIEKWIKIMILIWFLCPVPSRSKIKDTLSSLKLYFLKCQKFK